ncbi:hypothetical protein ACIQMJ_28540 [Actinosynnema sp. NPDC091369]
MELPPAPFRPVEPEEHAQSAHREFRDRLRWTIAADTLFVVGSRRAYELRAHAVRAPAEDCPAHLAASPGTHCCAEIGMGRHGKRDGRGPYAELHVECCNRHW